MVATATPSAPGTAVAAAAAKGMVAVDSGAAPGAVKVETAALAAVVVDPSVVANTSVTCRASWSTAVIVPVTMPGWPWPGGGLPGDSGGALPDPGGTVGAPGGAGLAPAGGDGVPGGGVGDVGLPGAEGDGAGAFGAGWPKSPLSTVWTKVNGACATEATSALTLPSPGGAGGVGNVVDGPVGAPESAGPRPPPGVPLLPDAPGLWPSGP